MSRTQKIVLLVLVPVVVIGGLLIGRAVRPGNDASTIGIGSAAANNV